MSVQHFASIIDFVDVHHVAAYLLLFLVMVWEGETFLIIAGVLIHLGAFQPTGVFLVSFTGVLLGDILWYFVGRALTADLIPPSFAFVRRTAEGVVARVFPNFRAKPFLSLFIAKFIYGTNHATLVLSGLIRMPFQFFLRAEIIVSFVWVIVFIALGYLIGEAAIQITHRLSVLLLLVVVFIAAFLSIQRLISYFYEHKENRL